MRFVIILSLVLLLAVSGIAVAGEEAGCMLLVHTDPSMVYTNGCSAVDTISTWDELDPTGAGTGVVNWIVVAAFPPGGAEELNTISFGLGDYNPAAVSIGNAGPCSPGLSPLEISTQDWPLPGSGTAVSWAPNCNSGSLVPVYRFTAYVYATGSIPLAPHPTQGWVNGLVRCNASTEPILGYGKLGFGEEGYNPNPSGAPVHVEASWGVIQTATE
ncbi:MAG: hypothetical protein GF355_13335 [Candidatus Eisenbacteria bacterium]|nr:hypothetical protein [Candidatus Eisenbacteria bacterium]